VQTIAWEVLMENGEDSCDICFILSIFGGNIFFNL